MKIKHEFEEKIDSLIGQMSLGEKVDMCHANSFFYSNGVERLGIEELAMMDGPHGVRSETERDTWKCLNRSEDKCTYLPTGTALAATWNATLAERFGETLGSEARYRGKDVILGPGINIIRTPLCGRNFEYMSEDPCLIQKIAPSLVKGIESQDVAACVKHYCLNNQEMDRHYVNVEVSRRALFEIYLKGFYSAIMEGGASSVMGAYNRYEGQFCCHHDYLVNKILKEKWGFQGVFLSDWAGAMDTDESIFHGLDIEMGTNKPYNEYYLADAFLKKAKESSEVREILDEKVRRILRLMFSIHKHELYRKKGEFNTKKHQNVAYDVAAEAMVLLKNEKNLLPIRTEKSKTMLVVGPNANAKHAEGGNSSGVRTIYEITPLEGIRNRFGNECKIEYESGKVVLEYNQIPTSLFNIIEMKAGVRAFQHTYYYHKSEGRVDKQVTYSNTSELTDHCADEYDLECSVNIPETGEYSFAITSNAAFSFCLNDKCCMKQHISVKGVNDRTKFEYVAEFKEGEQVSIKIHINNTIKNANFNFGWITPSERANISGEKTLLEKAKKADYVIYCGGIDHSFDTEGFDRKSMTLPMEQDLMISKLAEVNQNLIVVITAGSPVAMPWIGKVNAVVWSWYAGMEGGNVLGDILTGVICPSGKMPFTLPKRYEDTPVARYGEYQETNCKYNEDILVGYRGFDYDNIEPLFPFGHGLSYSKFIYSDLNTKLEKNYMKVSFDITNKGTVAAKEVAQVYIGDPVCSVKRPPKELRNFQKVELKPGETVKVELLLTAMDFSFYDEKTSDWKVEEGEFVIYVGSSSRDIRMTKSIDIQFESTTSILSIKEYPTNLK